MRRTAIPELSLPTAVKMSGSNLPAHGDRRGALPSAAAVDQELDSLADSVSVLQEGGADFCTAQVIFKMEPARHRSVE